jgi:alkaline phosphatase D
MHRFFTACIDALAGLNLAWWWMVSRKIAFGWCLSVLVLLLFTTSCQNTRMAKSYPLAFGSCTDPYKDSLQLWKEIRAKNASMMLVLGDIVYSKSTALADLQAAYLRQKQNIDFRALLQHTKVDGIYDDNDYGQNDGGKFNPIKTDVKELVLDLFDVPAADARYKREGLYFSMALTPQAQLVVIDTRTCRDTLTPANEPGKRYRPNTYGQGTMLGETQWMWLEQQLAATGAPLILLASTIQVLNGSHHYESWGNMPHERDRLFALLKKYPQKRVILISGDRHFSEISKMEIADLGYPLYDITCSGLTQTYSGNFEANPLRVGPFINNRNYCLLYIGQRQIGVRFFGSGNQLLYKYRIAL